MKHTLQISTLFLEPSFWIFPKLHWGSPSRKNSRLFKLNNRNSCEISDVSRVFLGRPVHTSNARSRQDGWRWAECFSKLVPPETLKKHSLALSTLKFLCKTFPKLLKLSLQKTLFRGWFLKNSYIRINILYGYKLWELRSGLSLKDAVSSTDEITQSSVNYLRKRARKYSRNLLHS